MVYLPKVLVLYKYIDNFCNSYLIGIMKNRLRFLCVFALLFCHALSVASQTIDRKYVGSLFQSKNWTALKSYLMPLAQQGDVEALFLMGEIYYNGWGCKRSVSDAAFWYERAAEKGDSSLMNIVAIKYEVDLKNSEKAFYWYKKAAENGHVSAMNLVGCKYEFQYKNIEKAFYWYQKAAEHKYLPAVFGVAKSYHLGVGTKRDLQKAFKWYKVGANEGEIRCEVMLSYCYEKGIGCGIDTKQAEEWLRRAATDINKAKRKDAFGQFLLGSINSLVQMFSYDSQRRDLWTKVSDMLTEKFEKGTEVDVATVIFANSQTKKMPEVAKPQPVRPDIAGINSKPKPNTEPAKPVGFVAANNSKSDTNKPLKPNNQTTVQPAPQQNEENLLVTEDECLSDRTFVVVIANENYQEVEPVEFALNDGRAFAKACKDILGIPDENIKIRENATLNNIRSELAWLHDVSEVYSGKANVILYYAGHGIPEVKSRQGYLLPVDGMGGDVRTAYALSSLYDFLNQLNTEKTIVMLDACFSGSQRGDRMLASSRGVEIAIEETKPKGNVVVLTAAQGDQSAYPYKEKQHGLFTYFLLESLKKTNGSCTLGDMAKYITREVSRKSTVINKKKQSPTVIPSSICGNKWESFKFK